jgi:hypothetical protein
MGHLPDVPVDSSEVVLAAAIIVVAARVSTAERENKKIATQRGAKK